MQFLKVSCDCVARCIYFPRHRHRNIGAPRISSVGGCGGGGAPTAVVRGVAQVELEVVGRPQNLLRRRRDGDVMPLRRNKRKTLNFDVSRHSSSM